MSENVVTRRKFLQSGTLFGSVGFVGSQVMAKTGATPSKPNVINKLQPTAITMWEFSWLERRWSGAGYEDWDLALYELKRRGYDSIRIDAFPHLIDAEPEVEHTLIPIWNTQVWGSPSINRIKDVAGNLVAFISKCKEYSIKVGLSSWWREDKSLSYNRIKAPEDLARSWVNVLDLLKNHDLLDQVFYMDFSNEWPHPMWTPYKNANREWEQWYVPESLEWMRETVRVFKQSYPEIPCTFSFFGEIRKEHMDMGDLSFLDLLEPHLWMANNNSGEFYQKVGYTFEKITNEDYENVALNAERIYRENENYWKDGLAKQIDVSVQWSKKLGIPLMTTECWGPIDYKDWPLLNWDWVMDICQFGVEEASKSGRWLSNATSNFCGPQFVGMWREKEWHLKLTDTIKQAPVDKDLQDSLLAKRIMI